MAYITPDGQVVGDPSVQEPLKRPTDQLQRIRTTNALGLEQDTIETGDPTIFDPYATDHKTSIQVSVFFGPFFIKEIAGIEMMEESTKSPVYHYASDKFSSVIKGKYIARGNLYVYETGTGSFHSEIAKYRRLLEEENINDLRIREIAAQRLNLLGASIESSLLQRFGAEQAAQFSERVVQKIDTEIISDERWAIPQITIISGSVTDENPHIDVFEDLTLNKASKAIVPDGNTQIRVYHFIGKRRRQRDTPRELSDPDLWELNLNDTIRSYTRGFVDRFSQGLKERVDRTVFPLTLHPNNLMYTGSLPSAITGWGPELCMSHLRFTQSLPENVSYEAEIVRERDLIRSDGTATRERDRSSQRLRRVNISRTSRFATTDPYTFLSNIRLSSNSIPSTPNLAFSWLIPPPGVDSSFRFRDEFMEGIHGSTATNAFFSLRMTSGASSEGEDLVRAHLPVRGMAYLQHPRLVNATEGEGEDVYGEETKTDLSLTSNTPINMSYAVRGQEEGASMKAWLKELQLSGENEDPTPYSYEKWYAFGFHLLSGFLGNLLEAASLGLLGNIDGVEHYQNDLDGFPLGATVDSVGVQVFPIIVPTGIPVPIPFAERITEEIERAEALDLLDRSTCIEEGAKWIWSINGIGIEDPPKLRIAVQWDADTLSSIVGDHVMVLVRVVSHNLNIPGSSDLESLNDVVNLTEFIPPSTVTMHNKCEIDMMVRCDRQYLIFPERPPFTWLRDITGTFSDAAAFTIGESGKYLLNTVANTGTGQAYYDSVYSGKSMFDSFNETTGIRGVTNAFGSATVDVLETSVATITGNKLFEDLGILSDIIIGFDPIAAINGIFRDSAMVQDPAPNMVSGYIKRSSYRVLLEPLAEVIANIITSDIESIADTLDNPSIFTEAGIASGTAGNQRVNSTLVKERTLAFLETDFRQLTPLYGYDVYRTEKNNVDPTFLTNSDQVASATSIPNNSPVMSIVKTPNIPSPFVLESVYAGLDQQYTESEATEDGDGPTPKGIVL